MKSPMDLMIKEGNTIKKVKGIYCICMWGHYSTFYFLGNLQNWWDDETKAKFLNKTQCIINQYGNYSVEELEASLNGITTQGENIADNGGVKEAYKAYGKSFYLGK